MKPVLFFLILAFAFWSCTTSLTDPQQIIDKAIVASGGEKYTNSTIEFDFRDRHYSAGRDGGKFSYERIFKDSTRTIHDYVSNDGFKREIAGVAVEVADSMKVKYTSSTNSVIYFALLPYGLNDPAVQKKFLGETIMDDKAYYKIEVSFRQAGGGEDFQDMFNYWISKDDFNIGFLSYSFSESDEINSRLRKGYNPRRIENVLFLDYINYKPKDNKVRFDQLEELYEKGELEELSKIELQNISVK
jgi:hypothetical protein